MSAEVETLNVRTKDRKADVSIKRFFKVIGKSDVDQALNDNSNQADKQKGRNNEKCQTDAKTLVLVSENGTHVDKCKSDFKIITRSSLESRGNDGSEHKRNCKEIQEAIQPLLKYTISSQPEVDLKVLNSATLEHSEKLSENPESAKLELVNIKASDCDRLIAGGVQETVESVASATSNDEEMVLLSYSDFVKEKQLSDDEKKDMDSTVLVEKHNSITRYFSSTRQCVVKNVEKTNGPDTMRKTKRCRKGRSRSGVLRAKKGDSSLQDKNLSGDICITEKSTQQGQECVIKRKTTCVELQKSTECMESDKVKRSRKRTKRSSKAKQLVSRALYPELRRSPRLEKLPNIKQPDKPDPPYEIRDRNGPNNTGKRVCQLSDDTLQGPAGMQNTSYKVAVISEKGGKKCIRLRITRLQKEESKAVVKKAQRILSKARKASSIGKESIFSQPPKKTSLTSAEKSGKKFEVKYPLAPLFLPSKSRSKKRLQPRIDAATLEKRKRFLASGIPEKLQRQMLVAETREALTEHLFPTIGHIGHFKSPEVDHSVLPWINHSFSEPEFEVDSNARVLCRGMLTYVTEATTQLCSKMEKPSLEAQNKLSRIDQILNSLQEQHQEIDVVAIYNVYVQKKEKAEMGNLPTEIGAAIATDADPFEFDQISDEDDDVPICALMKRTKHNGTY